MRLSHRFSDANHPNRRLLIIGASARAAAYSAARAGFRPLAADRFADHDLQQLAPVTLISRYPEDLPQVAASLPHTFWIYTGALENRPRIISQIAQQRPLLGNAAPVLRAVRDPWRLATALREAGLAAPNVLPATQTPSQGRWLVKPLRSCAGAKVRFCSNESLEELNSRRRRFYLQQFVPGPSLGGVFVGAENGALFIGATQQLIGRPWTGAKGYLYCGSVGPLSLPPSSVEQFQQIGQSLTERFSLRGIFGVDVIESHGRLWTLEVNPRYTASVEILERSLSWRSIRDHVFACESGNSPQFNRPDASRKYGKSVLYAKQDYVIPEDFPDRVDHINAQHEWPILADIPRAGACISTGAPMLTVFAEGESTQEVVRLLRRRAEAFSFQEPVSV